jgi:hypothetical protein
MDPIDRVRKLRALAENNTFSTEAGAAKSKALRIMAEHGLTETDVAPPPPLQRQVIYQGPVIQFMWGPMGFGFPSPGTGVHQQWTQAFQEGFVNAAGPQTIFFNVRFG